MRKKTLAAALCAATFGALSGSAFAGEVTGKGESTPIRDGVAASECAFSGRDDGDAGDPFTHVQSYGQLIKMFGPMGGVPGTACNPTRAGG